jgi:WD40-like Beta Propeller Repeat
MPVSLQRSGGLRYFLLLLPLLAASCGPNGATDARHHFPLFKATCKGNQRDRTPLIVASLRGAIYTVRADGAESCFLTPYATINPYASPSGYWITPGAAGIPHLSPTGSQIAYLTTTNINSHDVWVVPVNPALSSPRRLTTPSRTLDRESPSWSPDGKLLAYHEGNPVGLGSHASYEGLSIVVRRVDKNRTTIVSRVRFPLKGGQNEFNFGSESPTIVWSPDGTRVATIAGFVRAAGEAGKLGYPSGLQVGMAAIASGRTNIITVRFPNWISRENSARRFISGSYPAGDELAWTSDGLHLVITTRGQGEGYSLTGIWRVATGGGLAHLFVGAPADIYQHRSASPPIDNATQFLLLPNRRMLATDPNQRFWVTNVAGGPGTFTDPHIPSRVGCFLTQYSWLPNSSGFAYVKSCEGVLFHFTLYSVRLHSKARLLISVIDKQSDALVLGPSLRGGGY